MHKIMQMLHEDHVNVARLLDLMEASFQQLRQGKPEDLHLVRKSMLYMTAYPDMYHHPTEDVVFRHLVRKTPEASAIVTRLHAEHDTIGQEGRQLLTLLQTPPDSETAIQTLVGHGELYTLQLRKHMDTEEGEVFPMIKVILSPHDWNDVQKSIDSCRDPLFGVEVQQSYQQLAKRLAARPRQGG